jgi:hypothetical protein
MKWTNEELKEIAKDRYGIDSLTGQLLFINGVDFALQELEFEDYDGRIVNDGGKHYTVKTESSLFGEVRTFYATEAELNQAIGAQKTAVMLLGSFGLEDCVGAITTSTSEGYGSLVGESFSVMGEGEVVSAAEAVDIISKELLERLNF